MIFLNALLYLGLLTLSFLVIVIVALVPCFLLQTILYGLWKLTTGETSTSRKNRMKDNLFMLSAWNIFKGVFGRNRRKW